ncbi:BnaA03g46850D [Brassica napus]|uniref:BnaA03g46850D protein n=1 Tax=Brassica napus TaxID=3708 RepID=A0A078C5M7_BRANA|nr:BnaA03g46850D [Brassica napus]
MLHPRRKLLTLPFSMLEARLLLPELLILIPQTKTMTLVLWSMLRTCTLSTKRLRASLRCICRHILRSTKDEIDSSRLAYRQRVTASRPSKYEEIWPPQVNDLLYITDNSYQSKQILLMEKTIMGSLEWYLTVPTQYVFLARSIKAANPDPEMENKVHFLAELGLMHTL